MCKSIFIDEWGELQLVWQLLLLFTVPMLLLMGFINIVACKSSNEKELSEIANLKAKCESIGGYYGEKQCYKDGKIIYSIEGGNNE